MDLKAWTSLRISQSGLRMMMMLSLPRPRHFPAHALGALPATCTHGHRTRPPQCHTRPQLHSVTWSTHPLFKPLREQEQGRKQEQWRPRSRTKCLCTMDQAILFPNLQDHCKVVQTTTPIWDGTVPRPWSRLHSAPTCPGIQLHGDQNVGPQLPEAPSRLVSLIL